jgi:hypothetical protein
MLACVTFDRIQPVRDAAGIASENLFASRRQMRSRVKRFVRDDGNSSAGKYASAIEWAIPVRYI